MVNLRQVVSLWSKEMMVSFQTTKLGKSLETLKNRSPKLLGHFGRFGVLPMALQAFGTKKFLPVHPREKARRRQKDGTEKDPKDVVIEDKLTINGRTIHYTKVGIGRNNILFLPSALGCASTDFSLQLQHMNRELFTLVAWDPSGYGRSVGEPRSWGQPDMFYKDAEDAAELMDFLQCRKYSVVGWGDGGITALIMANMYRHLIRKIILWHTRTTCTAADVEVYKHLRDVDSWSKQYIEMYGRDQLQKLIHLWFETFSSYVEAKDERLCEQLLENVRADVLILHGGQDPFVPAEHARYIASAVKAAA